jgi:hypothetical protein
MTHGVTGCGDQADAVGQVLVTPNTSELRGRHQRPCRVRVIGLLGCFYFKCLDVHGNVQTLESGILAAVVEVQMAVHDSDHIPVIDTTFGQRVVDFNDRGLVYFVDECVTPTYTSIHEDHAFRVMNQIGEDGSLTGLGCFGMVLGQHQVGQGKTLDSRNVGEPCHAGPFSLTRR